MKTKNECLWEVYKTLQDAEISFDQLVKTFTEFQLLYKTPEGFAKLPFGQESTRCFPIGIFPFNIDIWPHVTTDMFILFDEYIVEDVKGINLNALFTHQIWGYVYRNLDNINKVLISLGKKEIKDTYLCYISTINLFQECLMKAWKGTYNVMVSPYPSSANPKPVKYRICGRYADGKIYELDGKTELQLDATDYLLCGINGPKQLFDLLCEINGQKQRLPYKQGKDKNPIGIFPFEFLPHVYIELNEQDNTLRENADDDRLPPCNICEEIWRNSAEINRYLMDLHAPLIEGCYFSKQGRDDRNWIVRLDIRPGEVCMPSDYYDTYDRAKIRYVGWHK